MPIDLRQVAGFVAGFWLALHLLLPLVDAGHRVPPTGLPAVSAASDYLAESGLEPGRGAASPERRSDR